MTYLAIALTIGLLTSLYLNHLWLNNEINGEIGLAGSVPPTQSELYEDRKDHDSFFRQTDDDDEDEEVAPMNVAIYDGNAYWIADGGFMTAPLDDDKEVVHSMKKQIDTHSMTPAQIDMMLEILDALKEASDEGFGTGQ